MSKKLEIFSLTKSNCRDFAKQISALHLKTLDKKISPDYWRWRYFSDTGPQGSLIVALSNGKVLGTYGLLYIPLIFKKKKVFAGLMGNLAVCPGGKSWLCYKSLIIQSMEQSKNHELLFRIGLVPEKKVDLALRMGVESLGYMPICFGVLDFVRALRSKGIAYPLAWLTKVLNPFFAVPCRGKNSWQLSFKQIEYFDQSFDAFYAEYARCFDVYLLKNSQYLNWRYADCPQKKYYKIAVYKHNKVQGYIVFCLTAKPGGACIVELMAAEKDKNIMEQLILKACRMMKQLKAGIITVSFADNSKQAEALKSIGFRKWLKKINKTHMLIGANTTEHFFSVDDFKKFAFGLGDWMEF